MRGLPAYAPMMATLGGLPPGGDEPSYTYEMKWDGVRALGYLEGGRLRLVSRNGRDVTVAYPELAPLGAALEVAAVLDGEIVAFDTAGRPSFSALQPRMHQRNPARIEALVTQVPVTYLIFDVLHRGDERLTGLPYTRRREIVESFGLSGPRWDTPPRFDPPGAEVLAQSRRLGLEGVLAKRRTSAYHPGRRSPEWIKVKNISTQEVVVCGWKPGEGRRSGRIGSLLLGVYEGGRLRYAGNVGTGFTEAVLDDLARRLAPLERADPPFAEVPRADARDARWVRPELVGEVAFTEWTGDHRLRHPSWRGLRADKDARQIVREEPA